VSLEQLLEDGVIDEVLSRLKSGKEADVWLARYRDQIVCAKVYKDRNFRSFKNNAGYREGRAVRNTRTQRAMDRGSRFGRVAAEEAWRSAESDALHRLHAEGVRVPKPVLFYEGILLMHLVLDESGQPAPRLIDAALTTEQAAQAYADLRGQAVRMLCCDLIHGDLSPYNVLLGAEGPTIIDFPQVVSAAQNSSAEMFFTRDVESLRKFFAGFAPELAARTGDAGEIWRAYVRRELAPDFVPSGRPPPAPQERRPRKEKHRPQHGQHPQGQPHAQHPRQGQPHAQHPRQGQPHAQHPRQGQPHAQHPRQGQPHAQHPRQGQPHAQHPRQGQPHAQHPRPEQQSAQLSRKAQGRPQRGVLQQKLPPQLARAPHAQQRARQPHPQRPRPAQQEPRPIGQQRIRHASKPPGRDADAKKLPT
jgi:RIO kinase 1